MKNFTLGSFYTAALDHGDSRRNQQLFREIVPEVKGPYESELCHEGWTQLSCIVGNKLCFKKFNQNDLQEGPKFTCGVAVSSTLLKRTRCLFATFI